LISITDGQIYLSPTLFELGVLPAVDIGKSVSRVGDKAQLAVYRTATGSLKLDHAQFEELETFARFGTRLDEQTRKTLEHGKRIRAALKQPDLAPVSVSDQIILLMALTNGLLDEVPVSKIKEAETLLRSATAELPKDVLEVLHSDRELSETDVAVVLQLCTKIILPLKQAAQ
jgi:F-type H+-transporting ATPase subunit alpha